MIREQTGKLVRGARVVRIFGDGPAIGVGGFLEFAFAQEQVAPDRLIDRFDGIRGFELQRRDALREYRIVAREDLRVFERRKSLLTARPLDEPLCCLGELLDGAW